MDPSLITVIALVIVVLALMVLRPIVRRATRRRIADMPAAAERRRADAIETLGTALVFDDPIAGRSLVGRTIEGKRLAQSIGENAWRVGMMDVGGVELAWSTQGGRGVLAATRSITIGSELVGSVGWTPVVEAVEKAAANEGIGCTRRAGRFVDSGERVNAQHEVWVSAAD